MIGVLLRRENLNTNLDRRKMMWSRARKKMSMSPGERPRIDPRLGPLRRKQLYWPSVSDFQPPGQRQEISMASATWSVVLLMAGAPSTLTHESLRKQPCSLHLQLPEKGLRHPAWVVISVKIFSRDLHWNGPAPQNNPPSQPMLRIL